MANLKADLLNDLNNQKYYSEMELLRLAQDPNMNYKYKIGDIIIELKNIASLNQTIALADGYFQVPEPQVQQPQVQVPQAPVEEVPNQPQVDSSLPQAPVEEKVPVSAPAVSQPIPGQSHAE